MALAQGDVDLVFVGARFDDSRMFDLVDLARRQVRSWSNSPLPPATRLESEARADVAERVGFEPTIRY